jgi:DNA-binding transcriptional LysR family regulator
VALTPAGEAFLGHTRHVLAMLHRMKEEGQQIANGFLGQLALGLSSSVIYSDIPQRISVFKRAFPNIDIRLDVHPGDYLRGLMDNGQLDVVVTHMPMPSPDYRSIVVSRQLMGVALPKLHRLANRRYLTIDDLKNEHFIVVPRQFDPHAHDILVSRFLALGTTLQVAAYETPSMTTLGRVSIGQGVALLPIGYRSEKHDSVRVVRLKDRELGSTLIYATIRKDTTKLTTERFMRALTKSKQD